MSGLTRRGLLRRILAAPLVAAVAAAVPERVSAEETFADFSEDALQRELRAYAAVVRTRSTHAGPVGSAYYRSLVRTYAADRRRGVSDG